AVNCSAHFRVTLARSPVLGSLQPPPLGSRALPANLCLGSTGAEALGLGDDFCESVREPVEADARGAIWQRAAEHLQDMLSTEQRIDDAAEVNSKRSHRSLGLGRQMPRLRTRQLELPLEISQGHVQVAHGHVWID